MILLWKKILLKKNFGVLNIGLFGSYAKDQQNPDSDIDFLVEFSEPRFDWLASLQIYMGKNLIGKLKLPGNLVWVIADFLNMSNRKQFMSDKVIFEDLQLISGSLDLITNRFSKINSDCFPSLWKSKSRNHFWYL